MATVDTGICALCDKPGSLEVTEDQLNRVLIWRKYRNVKGGVMIQQILSDLSAGDREQIMSGSHEACFDEAFPEDDEEMHWSEYPGGD
jgi:hypothetical protein